MISENTAKQSGGRYLRMRFADALSKKPVPDKDGGEIALDIIRTAGLEVTLDSEPI